jgi:hypothetical protein
MSRSAAEDNAARHCEVGRPSLTNTHPKRSPIGVLVAEPTDPIRICGAPAAALGGRPAEQRPQRRSEQMPTIIFTHAVSDRSHWASKHSERVKAFAPWGRNVVDYLSADGGNKVAVSVDVYDMAGMQAALSSPEIAAAKRAHGVLEPIAMHVEQE